MTSAIVDLLPLLISMLVLVACSAFFSASEAALFYLRPADRRKLATGGTAQRVASRLLADPDRLALNLL